MLGGVDPDLANLACAWRPNETLKSRGAESMAVVAAVVANRAMQSFNETLMTAC